MKNNTILIIFLLLIIGLFNTQTTEAQIRFGIKGGIDVAEPKLNLHVLKVDNRLGFQIGPTAEFLLPGSGFGTEISLIYGRKEYSIAYKESDATISDFNYISIPFNLKKRFGAQKLLGAFILGGVYGDVKISGGNIKIKDVIDEYKSQNFAMGVNVGLGISLLKSFDVGFYFKGDFTTRYKDGLLDKDIIQDKKNRTWSVGLNYYF